MKIYLFSLTSFLRIPPVSVHPPAVTLILATLTFQLVHCHSLPAARLLPGLPRPYLFCNTEVRVNFLQSNIISPPSFTPF